MADILLIHGASHGAWAWRDLIPELQALGHSPRALDLPGHGANRLPPEEVTLERYVEAIKRALGPRTMVVAHSMGGIPASLAADRAKDQVSRLVYLCAYAPQDGRSLVDIQNEAEEQPLRAAIRLAEDRNSFTFADEALDQALYGHCTPEQRAYARLNLCPQPISPPRERVSLSDTFGDLPKAYIRCRDDGVIPYAEQVKMSKICSEHAQFDMDSDHSPFFSHAKELASLLDRIAGG